MSESLCPPYQPGSDEEEEEPGDGGRHLALLLLPRPPHHPQLARRVRLRRGAGEVRLPQTQGGTVSSQETLYEHRVPGAATADSAQLPHYLENINQIFILSKTLLVSGTCTDFLLNFLFCLEFWKRGDEYRAETRR